MNIKQCVRCGIQKPTTEYHKDRYSKDNLLSYCKDCVKAYDQTPTRKTYRHNYMRSYMRAYTQIPKSKEYRRAYYKVYYQKHKPQREAP